nr:LysR family transcriptional regulator [Variovorax sp. YR216]
MNVTLRQLRAFVALARIGSFTLAAESLFITQSALSGLIKELEQTLGVRLVDRSTRRVHLTPIGDGLHPLLDGVLHDLDAVLHRVNDHRALKIGVVRLATTQLLASTLVPDLIASFQREHPNVQVSLIDAPAESVMARVYAGEVELGIGPERGPNSDITSTQLFDGPFMAVCPPGHPLVGRRRLRWSDLMEFPVIALQGQFTERLAQDLRTASRSVNFSPTHEVAYMATALSMVKAGLGVALCIPYATSLIDGYGLKMIPLRDPEVRRSFDVFTRKGRSLSPASQSFLDFIGPRIRGLPYLA